MTFREAIIEAIREEMRRDRQVFLLGQDIGARGGPFGSTKGLWDEFGKTGRLIDTPISESAMAGAGIGAAVKGMRPIVEIGFSEFLPTAMAQIVHDAANIWYYTAGAARVPLVIRTKFGTDFHWEHAQNFESWFVHVPGLKVVMPSTPYDVKGLFKSAIRDDNPVIMFEHVSLYGVRGEVPETEYTIPLGVADVKRNGRDVTLVATALMIHRSLQAAETLSKEGIEVEVVDPRTLAPLDKGTLLASVRKTGRLVVVHEAWKIGGIGEGVAAMVAEEGFRDLKAPIVRVGAPHIPIPFSPALGEAFLPGEEQIIQAIRKVTAK
jgi:pyruvate dehydrogenase E1 component beta subunit